MFIIQFQSEKPAFVKTSAGGPAFVKTSADKVCEKFFLAL